MKTILYTTILFILILSCNNKETKIIKSSSRFCNNELNLISSFDSLRTLKGNFKFINGTIKKEISDIFESDSCCKDLRFNAYFKTDSLDLIKISLKYYYHCENCPLPKDLQTNNYCVILQNSQGQIFFQGEFIPIDSLDQEIYNYYSQIGNQDFFPTSFDDVNISLQWDLNVSDKNFTSFINKIIKGYLSFVDEISQEKYNKKICQLNREELENLAKFIPFYIEIPTFEVIEEVYDMEIDTLIN